MRLTFHKYLFSLSGLSLKVNIHFLSSLEYFESTSFTVEKYMPILGLRQPSFRKFSSNVTKSSGRGTWNSKYSFEVG